MRVILYMAITPNGFIAKLNDDTDWISSQEWDCYSAFIRVAGNLIVGHRTYEILTKQPGFSELKNVKLVVVSTQQVQLIASNHQTASTPADALSLFQNEETVVVAGGGALNASFLEQNLVDEIYLDIEPIIFGSGIQIFHGKEFQKKLELLEIKHITNSEIQLHYKIVK